jgi:TonB family protein
LFNLSIPAEAPNPRVPGVRIPVLPLASFAALICALFAASPLWAQTPAAPAGSTNRTEDPAYSVFRWIKIQGDAQRKPADAPKPKPKAEPAAAPPVRRPEAQATAPATATERPQANEPSPAPTAAASAVVAPQAASNVVPVTSAPVAAVTAAAAPAAPVAEANDELDADLKVISQAQPEFPRELRTVISYGKVVVSFTVQPDGTVADPTVVSYTNRKLGKPATDAVSKWVFEPVRIPRTVQVEIAFNAQ